jgi:hypothetical protein
MLSVIKPAVLRGAIGRPLIPFQPLPPCQPEGLRGGAILSGSIEGWRDDGCRAVPEHQKAPRSRVESRPSLPPHRVAALRRIR